MAVNTDDDQKLGHEYDDDVSWYEPLRGQSEDYAADADDESDEDDAPSAAGDDSDPSQSNRAKKGKDDYSDDSALKDAEESADDGSWKTTVGDAKERDQAAEDKREETKRKGVRGLWDRARGRTSSSNFGLRRYGLIAGSGGALMLIGAVMIFIVLIGSFKAVHFATVLRSAGFARFNLVMKRQFSQTVFDAAVMTDSSTGSLRLQDRSLMDRLRRINPEKQLGKLGREGTMKFNFEGENRWGGLSRTNTFKGVEINGRNIDIDQLAKDAFPNRSGFNDLSFRERLTVRSQFVTAAKEGLSERLALEGRSFRGSVYRGLQEASGISLVKWRQAARDYFGKTPKEARAQNVDDTMRNVEGDSARPRSGVSDEINEQADAEREVAIKEAKGEVPAGSTTAEGRARLARRANAMGKISMAVLGSTVACIIHDLDNSFKSEPALREKQTYRFASDIQTGSQQMQDGQVTAPAAGAENARYINGQNAAYYKAFSGKPLDSEDLTEIKETPDIRPPNMLFANVISVVNDIIETSVGGPLVEAATHIPGLGPLIENGRAKLINGGCKIILNEYVQYGIALGEIAFAIISVGTTEGAARAVVEGVKQALVAAGTVGAGEIAGSLIEDAIDIYGNTDYAGTAQGEALVNQGFIATEALAQTGNRKITYGGPMTTEEAAAAQQTALAELREENRHRPFTERYFAFDNPFSLVGSLAAITPSSWGSTVSSAATFFGRLPSNAIGAFKGFGNVAMGPFSSKASAAIGDITNNYGTKGVDGWGWTDAELTKTETDEAYTSENLEAYMDSRLDDLDAKFMPCYEYMFQSEPDDGCTDAVRDSLRGEEGLKWRTYKARFYAASILAGDLSAE